MHASLIVKEIGLNNSTISFVRNSSVLFNDNFDEYIDFFHSARYWSYWVKTVQQ